MPHKRKSGLSKNSSRARAAKVALNQESLAHAELRRQQQAERQRGQAATNTMTRINDNSTVVGTIIVNREGFPETTTLDSLTAATYSNHMRNLCRYAAEAVKELDVTDEMLCLRMISKKTEAAVIPDPEFHLIVVMRRKNMA